MVRASAESKHRRLGLIIKIIANHPGIRLKELLRLVTAGASPVSERTLTKDILLLKNELKLLPQQKRLRNGYILSDMFTLAVSEYHPVRDAIFAFAVNLQDEQFHRIMQRMLRQMNSEYGSNKVATRLVGQRVMTKSSARQIEIEKVLLDSIAAGTAVSFEYLSPRLSKPLKSSAYVLFKVFYQRAWYVIVKDINDQNYYPCRLDRIPSAQMKRPRTINRNFLADAEEACYLMSCGWGMTFPATLAKARQLKHCPETIVRFDSSVAQYIMEGLERHPKAKVSLTNDGTGDALFKIRLADLWEFKHWVRSFGAAAWFLAPNTAVDQEKAEIARMKFRYGMSNRVKNDYGNTPKTG